MGDLNGKVGNDRTTTHGVLGPFGGEQTRNSNGDRIIDFCATNDLLIANSYYNHRRIHQITFENTQFTSVIDYILIPRELKNKCRDVKVVRGAELSTDHHLLVADMVFARGRRRRRTSYQRVKYEKLKNPEIREDYQEMLRNKLLAPIPGQDVVEESWERIKTSILEACTLTCGMKRIKEGTKKTKWWNADVKQVVAEKKKAWGEWKRYRTPAHYDAYVRQRNSCKAVVKRAKRESWEAFGEELDRDYVQDNKKFWKFLRAQRGKYGRKVRSIKDSQNVLKTETEEVLEVWKKHYEAKFKENRVVIPGNEVRDSQRNIV